MHERMKKHKCMHDARTHARMHKRMNENTSRHHHKAAAGRATPAPRHTSNRAQTTPRPNSSCPCRMRSLPMRARAPTAPSRAVEFSCSPRITRRTTGITSASRPPSAWRPRTNSTAKAARSPADGPGRGDAGDAWPCSRLSCPRRTNKRRARAAAVGPRLARSPLPA